MKKYTVIICILFFVFLVSSSLSTHAYAVSLFVKSSSDKTNLSERDKNIEKIRRKKFKVGQHVTLGEYYTGYDEEEKSPVEWIVAAVNGNKNNLHVLLISEYVIEAQPYNDTEEYVTWENCSLRQWLNSTFYDNCFSENEKTIISAPIEHGSISCIDNVFIPSYEEVSCLISYEQRAKATRYAYKQGLLLHRSQRAAHRLKNIFDYDFGDSYNFRNSYAAYMMRPSDPNSDVLEEIDGWGVYKDSMLLEYYDHKLGIRPAIWLSINK